MSTSFLPTTEEIALAFTEEIAGIGGAVSDSYDDGQRLFLRSVLPAVKDVRPGDTIRAGIALRTAGPNIAVHPYTYRQVCTNGAIHAHAMQTRNVARVEFASAMEFASAALDAVRMAVRQCAAPEAFRTVVDEMRTASETAADLVIHLLPMLSRMPGAFRGNVLRMITERFEHEQRSLFELDRRSISVQEAEVPRPREGRSLYALMNAVTSVARDMPDPDVKWRLEELGGGMPALIAVRPRVRPPAAELMTV